MEDIYEHLVASLYGDEDQYSEFGDDQSGGEPAPDETAPGTPEEGEEPPEEEDEDEEEEEKEPETP